MLLLIPPAYLVSENLAKWEENDINRFGVEDIGEEKVKRKTDKYRMKSELKRTRSGKFGSHEKEK